MFIFLLNCPITIPAIEDLLSTSTFLSKFSKLKDHLTQLHRKRVKQRMTLSLKDDPQLKGILFAFGTPPCIPFLLPPSWSSSLHRVNPSPDPPSAVLPPNKYRKGFAC